jgi:hypothetical protein
MSKISIKYKDLTADVVTAVGILADKPISAVCAFKISRIIRELNNLMNDKQVSEAKILDKFAAKDENGEYVRFVLEDGTVDQSRIRVEDPEGYQTEMTELMELVVELEQEKLNFEDLRLDVATSKELYPLDFLFN